MKWIEKDNEFELDFKFSCNILPIVCPCYGESCLFKCHCQGDHSCHEQHF